jgi:DNA-binding IclR family transcriptional regulator
MGSDQTGSLRRAMVIMRVLANVDGRGAGLTDIARQAHLPHPTAHRLLLQMIEEGMARRVENDRRYALGPVAFELGLAAARQLEVRQLYRPIISDLARESGDTAYLIARSGLEAVCVDRRQGTSPVQVITLKIGSRRPLGVGAGGLALLAALPDDERAQVMRAVAADLETDWHTSPTELGELVERIHRDGYTLIHNRVFQGVSALGRPILDAGGRPVAAVSIATINQRMRPSRVRELDEYLRRAVLRAQSTIATAALSAAGDDLT